MTEWTAQVNDLVGGWIVTTYPHRLSAHDTRPDGDPAKRGKLIADCCIEADAALIAELLNGRDRSESSRRDWAAEAMRLEEQIAAQRKQARWVLSDGLGHACFGSDGEPGECTSVDAHMSGCPDSPWAERDSEGAALPQPTVCACITDDQAAQLGPHFSRPVCAVHEEGQ